MEQEIGNKMSYDELEKQFHKLQETSQKLYEQYRQMAEMVYEKRLDYLFRILDLKNKGVGFSDDIVKSIVAEIERAFNNKSESNDTAE